MSKKKMYSRDIPHNHLSLLILEIKESGSAFIFNILGIFSTW